MELPFEKERKHPFLKNGSAGGEKAKAYTRF
jgi:hypothetical protein